MMASWPVVWPPRLSSLRLRLAAIAAISRRFFSNRRFDCRPSGAYTPALHMNRELPIVAKLNAELEELTRELKIDLPKQIETARAHGDLRENAEYHAAKERQGLVSARIGGITARLAELSRYNFNSIPQGAVGYGSLVELEELQSGDLVRYQLVFAEEVDTAAGKVSLTSPVGQAMLNRKEGDEIKIRLPSGVKRYEITELTTIHQREEFAEPE